MNPQRGAPEDDIGRRARRLKKARENPGVSPLRGLGAFGMVGWSIAVPTVGGAFLGLWLDRT
ncbi:MAG: ATPase F0F1, partial [Marinobacter sp.]|nr:ATPase F0F1 [Marinobacter sp.]